MYSSSSNTVKGRLTCDYFTVGIRDTQEPGTNDDGSRT